jgi:hypothetical protein
VGRDEGPLVVLPGSHRDHTRTFPYHGSPDVEGQVVLAPDKGDMVLIHSNLWHRTVPTSAACRRRRLVIVGYDPAWLNTAVPGAPAPERPLTRHMLDSPEPSIRELVGGFVW